MEKRASFIHRSNLKIRRERERERWSNLYSIYPGEGGERDAKRDNPRVIGCSHGSPAWCTVPKVVRSCSPPLSIDDNSLPPGRVSNWKASLASNRSRSRNIGPLASARAPGAYLQGHPVTDPNATLPTPLQPPTCTPPYRENAIIMQLAYIRRYKPPPPPPPHPTFSDSRIEKRGGKLRKIIIVTLKKKKI